MQLQIDAVHQPQRTELVLGQFASQTALDLILELLNAGGNKRVIKLIVTIHSAGPSIIS